MHWGSAAEFFAMGGYALYVWGAYVVTALVLIVEVRLLVSRRRSCLGSDDNRASGRFEHVDVPESARGSGRNES